MIALKTQSPAFWQKEFSVSDEDLQYLHEFVVETGKPVPTEDLVQALIRRRSQREIDSLRSELDRGPMYQPRDRYDVGQTIVFPALNFAAAKVIGSRHGHDPARGEFEVIQVQFEDSGDRREFASQLQSDHVLNRADGEDGLAFLQESVSVEELMERHGDLVRAKLLEKLRSSDVTDFAEYDSRWLAREMMAEIHVGHLNIAEAAIDVAGAPLTTDQLLGDLDLPAEIDTELQRFSLNASLSSDERFDDVGWDGHVAWFLRRMEPEIASEPPARLRWIPEPYDRDAIEPELLLIEREIDDEAVGRAAGGGIDANTYSARLTLTYPHVRSGTLPLSSQVRALLPKGSHQHTRIELVDGERGQTMVGWVNHLVGYIAGLTGWYEEHKIPAGAYIRLERTKKPGVLIINYDPRRMRREWVRVAGVQDDSITFGMQKRPIACEYDELMAVDHVDPQQIDAFVEQLMDREVSLSDIMSSVVPELIKLNPSGTVHAKTIYSAVNILRRCSPGPVLAILSIDPRHVYEGDGLFSFSPAGA